MDYFKTINSVQDLLDFVCKVNEDITGQWWWRGQEKYGLPLRPKVFRDNQHMINEKDRLLRFKKKAGVRHSSVPKQEQDIEWLFLMQHYGLPTRLLDWTESPLIACFFAVKNTKNKKEDEEDGELFAIHPYTLNLKTISRNELLMPEDPISMQLINNAYSGKYDDNSVIAIRPYEIDIRLMVQLSQFTLHGSDNSIEDIDNPDSFMRKIKISASKKAKISEELKFIGIRESVIFPDLDHLANEISNTYFKGSQEKEPRRAAKLHSNKSSGNLGGYGESSTG